MKEQTVESLWSHIYWLATLAAQGSYTAAAERLNVSKAAMSQRIAELERITGVSLVQRTTRSVRLTEAGQRLVEETGEIIAGTGGRPARLVRFRREVLQERAVAGTKLPLSRSA